MFVNITFAVLVVVIAALFYLLYIVSQNDDRLEEANTALIKSQDNEARYRVKYEEMHDKYYDEVIKRCKCEDENKELNKILDSIKNESDNTEVIIYNGMLYHVKDVTLWDNAGMIPNIDVNAILYPAVPKGE